MKRTTVSDRKSLNRLLTEAAANTARLPVGGKAAPKTPDNPPVLRWFRFFDYTGQTDSGIR
jgi:hypothetical protein